MLQKYVEFQDEVVRRRTQYDLKKAKERAHILEGLKKATDIVDELIATIQNVGAFLGLFQVVLGAAAHQDVYKRQP